MIEKGIISEINGGEATIVIARTDACAGCKGCLMSSDSKSMMLKAKVNPDFSVGDIVSFEINPGAVIRSSFLVLFFPLVMFIIGILAGGRFVNGLFPSLDGNTAGIIAGAVFLVITFIIVYFIERMPSRAAALYPRIISIEKQSSDSSGCSIEEKHQ
jgi:sigma-E factor negative regulatory protein RseC